MAVLTPMPSARSTPTPAKPGLLRSTRMPERRSLRFNGRVCLLSQTPALISEIFGGIFSPMVDSNPIIPAIY